MPTKDKKIYCSLDIETSDFDPSVGEILEIGMIFFEVADGKLKMLREWESTFKPSKEVPPRILALTGISVEELADSVLFADKRDEVQELIGDAVIVGHNINFDIHFLEGYGIKFSGKYIDTLELAQLFLPTAGSYNLESVMNLLKVEHKEAHRALADSRAALVVFEKLFQHFAAFPEALKQQLIDLFPEKTEIGEMLLNPLRPAPVLLKTPEFPISYSGEIDKSIKENKTIICFPLGFDYYNYVYGSIQKSKEKLVVVVPNKTILYQLWKNKLVEPLFENGDLFDQKRFEKNLKKKLTPELRLFFGKILVWQNTNWQAQSLVDINWSFGRQFKSLVSFDSKAAPVVLPSVSEKIVAIDYWHFIKNDFSAQLAKRKILILDINNFESALTESVSTRVSWNDFIFQFKQISDLQSRPGKKDLAAQIQTALAQVDLFFGLASMNFRKIDGEQMNISITKSVAARDEYRVIGEAAEGFCQKIEALNKKIKSDKISDMLADLRQFFVEDPEMVRWVEISEGRLTFSVSPVDLKEIAAKRLAIFDKIAFTASLGSDALIKYFTGRLSLENFAVKIIGQQELRKKIEVIISPETLDPQKFLELVRHLEFPAAVLLPGTTALREFYETNFKTLQQRYKVFVQGYTGGTTKLLENFSIAENSLFIATDKFVLKQIAKKLKVKTLVITRLPFDQFNHPLFAAQAEKYQNQFIDFNIPRALYNFHSVIRFFYSQDLDKIYILDQKINKDYGKYFTDYLGSLPFVQIKP